MPDRNKILEELLNLQGGAKIKTRRNYGENTIKLTSRKTSKSNKRNTSRTLKGRKSSRSNRSGSSSSNYIQNTIYDN